MSIKTPQHRSALEGVAYEQRLEQLGLVQQHDGTIKPGSLKNVQNAEGDVGADAVAPLLGADQVLTPDAAQQLQRTKRLFGAVLRKSDPAGLAIDQSHAVNALAMSCDGLNGAIGAELKGFSSFGMPTAAKVDKLVRRADHLAQQIDAFTGSLKTIGISDRGVPSGNLLVHASPGSVAALARSLGTLGGYSSELAEQLSAVRDLYSFSSADSTDAQVHKDALAASEKIARAAFFVGNQLGDKAAYMVAFAHNPADGAPVEGASVDGPSTDQMASPTTSRDGQVRDAMERDFPGIHDEFYGMSSAEKKAWENGGAAGLIDHLLGS